LPPPEVLRGGQGAWVPVPVAVAAAPSDRPALARAAVAAVAGELAAGCHRTVASSG